MNKKTKGIPRVRPGYSPAISITVFHITKHVIFMHLPVCASRLKSCEQMTPSTHHSYFLWQNLNIMIECWLINIKTAKMPIAGGNARIIRLWEHFFIYLHLEESISFPLFLCLTEGNPENIQQKSQQQAVNSLITGTRCGAPTTVRPGS